MAQDLAARAAVEQRGTNYRADTWMNATLPPMTKVWRGLNDLKRFLEGFDDRFNVAGKRDIESGESDFFFSEEDAREAKGSYMGSQPFRFAETLWRLAQVEKNEKHGFRGSIAEYVVNLPTPVAVGICRVNSKLGSGSLVQYYIPGWRATLQTTGRTHAFPINDYPKVLR